MQVWWRASLNLRNPLCGLEMQSLSSRLNHSATVFFKDSRKTVWTFMRLPKGSGIFRWTYSTLPLRLGSEKLCQRRRWRDFTLQLVENANLPCGHKVKRMRFNGNDSCAS